MLGHKGQAVWDLMKPYFSFQDVQRAFHFLKPFILRQWKVYCVLFLLLFIDIFLTIAFAWFFGTITDAAIQSDFAQVKELIPIGVGLIGLGIVSTYLDVYCETVSRHSIKRDLKNHLFHHILRLPTGRTTHMQSGELLAHFSNDIHSVDGVVGSSLLNLIRLPLVYISVFIFLIQINWTLSLISVLIAPIALIAGAVFGLLLRRNGRKIHSLVGKISSFQNEAFQGLSIIRSFTLEKATYDDYSRKNKELYDLEIENAKLQGWYYSGGQLVGSLSFLTSLCLGAYYVSKNVMSVGELIIFINLVNHLVYPLTGLAGQWAGFQRSVSAMERVTNVLSLPADTKDLSKFEVPSKELISIEFSDVSFSYDDTINVFETFSVRIPAGKAVALVGPSGAGKSTLFNLIQRWYTPQSGEISFNGRPANTIPLQQLRSMIAHVPQETFLFAGTIRENLLLARPGITENELVQASIDARIHDFITSLPQGYDTEIGERGVMLSGGQKQRISIARALLKNAPLLLLDEATSSLDSETEYEVQQALERLKVGRTTLIIAHRLSTIKRADLIFVIDKGEIVQAGNHEQLIIEDGLYRQLYDRQEPKQTTSHLSIVSK